MRLFYKILTLIVISFTKFTSFAAAEEIKEFNNKADQQVEGEEQFQQLLESVSPTQFQEMNEKDPDMSFSEV